jgi:hypothetical protein
VEETESGSPLGEKEAWERSGGDREWKSFGREGSLGAE